MPDVTITALPPVGMVALRGDPELLGRAVAEIAGPGTPAARMRTEAQGRGLLWMSPDDLLLTCDYAEAPALAERLAAALAGDFATVAVVSDARAVFALEGAVEDLLARLMPVDFARLAPAEVRRSRMAQIPAAIWREGEGWRLVCFRSVAGYAEGLLHNAAPVGA
ncbi:sarcosine oxidase subunit gamma [Jannaschia ovalis]|uniref:Sarcosine oxidase subunit gamma family protein n=1 Tax=Jannaschia ovalis TaxID=3038773 RepID=A0ABY8LBE6_9RHOB|nr:sarcosine oxidase subunit gamma family protein [Jannaschia sp. GRR-S6-38]WGH78653.1 sarcosine oxidase subunit gamma family protein [Jannaschia sp. GRR-S6-38]